MPMHSTEPASGGTHELFPLDQFYADAGRPLPAHESLPAESLPEPQRVLLAHTRDMTPTLEAFHGDAIGIDVLSRHRQGDFLLREVVLRLDDDGRPVEFGANRISLQRFSVEARWMILQGRLPLGRILKEHAIPHTTAPLRFFSLRADDFIRGALGLKDGPTLFGRCARIFDPQGHPLSEVVEILPPL